MVCLDMERLKANHDERPVKKTLTIPSWLNSAAEKKNIQEKKAEREIGILDGKVTIEFRDDFAMTGEELCVP